MSATVTPTQLRAGRALLNLSRAEFANLVGVHERTLAALELGENEPSRSTTMRLTGAFLRLGVEMIAEGEGRGAGVRLAEPEGGAIIVGRHVLKGAEELGVILRVAGKPMTARVSVVALAPDGDTDAALEAFDLRRIAIGGAIARKIEAQAFDADGHLRINGADLASNDRRAA